MPIAVVISFQIVSDEVYIDAFHATGCPNKNPYLEWWMSQSEEAVLNDMNTYCELIRDGHESDEQRSQCCGDEDCTNVDFVKQTSLTKSNHVIIVSYFQVYLRNLSLKRIMNIKQ